MRGVFSVIVEKEISRVSIGSYVVGIVKQRGSKKIKTQGWVRDLHAIEKLIELGVERVLVDTSKKLDSSPEKKNDLPIKSKVMKPKASFAESLVFAKGIFDQSKAIQQKVLNDIISGREIDVAPIKNITDETTTAVFDNPDALACIINIREKDQYLLEHSVSVSILMSMFCRFLGIEMQITKELAIGAFLHDVGKIMIDDKVLNKPGKLTKDEFEIIKTHVVHSISIINKMVGISKLSLSVAAMHHEKLDGSGYPKMLTGEQISKFGRMISICDIFDALTATRVYKDGMAHVKAFAILLDMATNNMLDKSLVNSFIKCMGVYPIGSLVKLNSDQLAVVETRNPNDPIRPKVKVFYSTSQSHFLSSKDIDLSSNQQKHIEKGVRAQDFDLDMNKILEFLVMEG